jgi:hypothetical protein
VPVNGGSYIGATTGEPRGIPAAEPVLRLPFDVEVGGLSDGASALFLITGSLRAEAGRNLSLGTAAPVLRQLGFRAREGGNSPYTTRVAAEWTLSDTAIERIEKIRDGANMVIYPNFEYALISPGTAMSSWSQPQRPLRVPFPGSRLPCGSTGTIGLTTCSSSGNSPHRLPLPAGAATDEHRTIVSRLTTAKQRLTAGRPDDLKASVAASGEAVELLRKMRPPRSRRWPSSAISLSARPSSST